MNRTRLFGGASLVVGAATCLLVLSGVLAEVERERWVPPRGQPVSPAPEPLPAEKPNLEALTELGEPALPEEGLEELEEPVEEPAATRAPESDGAAPGEAEPKRDLWELAYEGNNLLITDGGRPVSGLQVRLYDPRLVGGTPLEVAISDADGLVSFERAELGVRVFEGPPSRFLAPGETGAFDLQEETEFPLEGTVVGPDEEPVSGAHVSLHYGAYGLSAARSDASGAFSLLMPGSLGTLVVAADGYLPARVGLDTLRKTNNRVRLLRGDRGALGGVVIDERDQPLAGVLVRATSGTGGFLLAETDTFGHFGFEHLPAGPIVLQVHKGEVVPVVQQTADVRPQDVTEVTVRVTRQGALSLHVHDGPDPVPNADVRVTDSGVTRFGNFEANATDQRQATDGDGRVRFTLPAGGYYARIVVNGEDHTVGGTVVPGQDTQLSLDVGDRRSLSVHVVDPNGNPVPGVFMDVSLPGINWSGMPSTRTNAEGIGRFEQLPHGLAEVHLGKGGLWRMVRSDAEQVSFTWTEGDQLGLRGRVAGDVPQVLAVTVLPDVAKMHRVELVQAGVLDALLDVPAGAQGVFLLPPDQGLAPVALGEVPATGELSGFEVSFPRAGGVRGVLRSGGRPLAGRIVLGGSWAAVQEARVQWSTGTDHDPWITVNEWVQASGPDGAFVLRGLPPGQHTLELSAIGCRPRAVSATVESDGVADLGNLDLEPLE